MTVTGILALRKEAAMLAKEQYDLWMLFENHTISLEEWEKRYEVWISKETAFVQKSFEYFYPMTCSSSSEDD